MELRKNIVSVTTDRDGNVTGEVADYIGIEAFAKEIYNIYKECLDNYEDKDEFEQYINDLYFDQEFLKNRAYEFAVEVNGGMKSYLHQKDHRIESNFNNIDYDYPKYRTGTMWVSDYDGDLNEFFDLVPDMIKRLDSAEDSERANDDREFLSSWFFDTFGTFGIEYNFSNDLAELHYDMEEYYEGCSVTA